MTEYFCETCSRYHTKEKSKDDCDLDETDYVGDDPDDEDSDEDFELEQIEDEDE